MAKKFESTERFLKPDAKYHSRVIAKFINCLMHDGKKTTAERVFYTAMDIVAERVTGGQSDGQIISYFTERYGDGILLDPRFEPRTMLLWLLPAAALVGGGLMIWSRRRKPGEVSS